MVYLRHTVLTYVGMHMSLCLNGYNDLTMGYVYTYIEITYVCQNMSQ